jgi:hypothetical protein
LLGLFELAKPQLKVCSLGKVEHPLDIFGLEAIQEAKLGLPSFGFLNLLSILGVGLLNGNIKYY